MRNADRSPNPVVKKPGKSPAKYTNGSGKSKPIDLASKQKRVNK